jgi:hypothetical protein
MKTVVSSPDPNIRTRECSRKRPRMLRTRMVSDRPGIPGRKAQMPRTQMSDGDAGPRGAVESVAERLVHDRVHLQAMRAGSPASALAVSPSMYSTSLRRRSRGATISRRNAVSGA